MRVDEFLDGGVKLTKCRWESILSWGKTSHHLPPDPRYTLLDLLLLVISAIAFSKIFAFLFDFFTILLQLYRWFIFCDNPLLTSQIPPLSINHCQKTLIFHEKHFISHRAVHIPFNRTQQLYPHRSISRQRFIINSHQSKTISRRYLDVDTWGECILTDLPCYGVLYQV